MDGEKIILVGAGKRLVMMPVHRIVDANTNNVNSGKAQKDRTRVKLKILKDIRAKML